jgi:hypothetical protein
MTSKETNNEWLDRLAREQSEERRIALADAKQRALAEDKEPFDLDKLWSLWDFSPPMADTSWEPSERSIFALEERYYVRYPQFRTIEAFAAKMNELEPYR